MTGEALAGDADLTLFFESPAVALCRRRTLQDRLDRLSLILRGLQIFFALVMLLIAIVIASFQSKWVGGPSGLTGFLLFISIASLLTSVVFVVVPIVYERSDFKTFKGVHRAIKEARVGFVANGVWTALTLITA